MRTDASYRSSKILVSRRLFAPAARLALVLGAGVGCSAVGCSAASDPPAADDGTDANDAHPLGASDAGAPDARPANDAGAASDATSGDAADVDASLADAGADATDAPDAADAAPIDAAPPPLGLDCPDAGTAAPKNLGCTGLYEEWPTKTIARDVNAYDPAVHLWSDGATKRRFVRLPPGTTIDTSDMNEWTFPVGTKFWKEFSLDGKKVETRYLWKRPDGRWLRTTYAWSDDGQAATELTTGQQNVHGTKYEIPSQDQCETCHEGRVDNVLGFEAVGLSLPGATGLTMAELVARGWVTKAPSAPIAIPGNATEQAALGWLHANCGNACHSPSTNALANSTGLWMRLDVTKLATVQGTDTYKTAVNVPSGFQPTPGAGFMRIKPGDSGHSCIPYRDGTRDDADQGVQMPPIGTHVVDTDGVHLVKTWIDGMPH